MELNSKNNSQNNEILLDTDGVLLHRGKTPRTKEFTYKFMISCDGAPEVPLESLTAEQTETARQRMRGNLEQNMSEYYTYHPEEYSAL